MRNRVDYLDNIDDPDELFYEYRQYLLKMDSWNIDDAISFLTSDDYEKGQEWMDRQRNMYAQLLKCSIVAKTLIPDFDEGFFKQETIINWAIKNEVLGNSRYSDYLRETKNKEIDHPSDNTIKTNTDREGTNDTRLKALKELLDQLEKTAAAKKIPFDKQCLLCSSKMMLAWLQGKTTKPARLFKMAPATFSDFWSKHAKEYQFCPPGSVDKEFFTKIQG
jgi:hypothetical protein